MPEKTNPEENKTLDSEKNIRLNSKGMPILRAPGNPWSGLPIVDAQAHIMGLLFSSDTTGLKQLLDAINKSAPALGPEDIKAHIDWLERLGKLDATLEAVRDTALGRKNGSMVNTSLRHSNLMFQGICDEYVKTIATIWDSNLWAEMNALPENFIPAFPQIPMDSTSIRLPSPICVWHDDPAHTCSHSVELTASGLLTVGVVSQREYTRAAGMDLHRQIPGRTTDALHKKLINEIDKGEDIPIPNMDDVFVSISKALGSGLSQPDDGLVICHWTDRKRIRRMRDVETAVKMYSPRLLAGAPEFQEPGTILAVSRELVRFGVQRLPSITVMVDHKDLRIHVKMKLRYAVAVVDCPDGQAIAMLRMPSVGEREVGDPLDEDSFNPSRA